MQSVCFATIRLQSSWESSLLLPIMGGFLCNTLEMRRLFIGYHLFIWFQFVSWLSMPFCNSLSSSVQYFFPLSFQIISHYLIYRHLWLDFFLHVWITWAVTNIWWKFHLNSTLRNILIENVQYIFYLLYDHLSLYFPDLVDLDQTCLNLAASRFTRRW